MPQFEPPIHWNDHEDIAQKLYENGLITYMRTDAPSLSAESIADARMYIETNLGEKYLTNAPRIYSSSENAQEAHEAVRPTNASTTSDSLLSSSDEEKRLYSRLERLCRVQGGRLIVVQTNV